MAGPSLCDCPGMDSSARWTLYYVSNDLGNRETGIRYFLSLALIHQVSMEGYRSYQVIVQFRVKVFSGSGVRLPQFRVQLHYLLAWVNCLMYL